MSHVAVRHCFLEAQAKSSAYSGEHFWLFLLQKEEDDISVLLLARGLGSELEPSGLQVLSAPQCNTTPRAQRAPVSALGPLAGFWCPEW